MGVWLGATTALLTLLGSSLQRTELWTSRLHQFVNSNNLTHGLADLLIKLRFSIHLEHLGTGCLQLSLGILPHLIQPPLDLGALLKSLAHLVTPKEVYGCLPFLGHFSGLFEHTFAGFDAVTPSVHAL